MLRSPVLRAALVGLAAGALLLAAGRLITAVPCHDEGWGCLGAYFLGIVAAAAVLYVLAWIALHLLGVRPSWRVAVPAPALIWYGIHLLDTSHSEPENLWLYSPLLVAAAYALPAAVALPGPTDRRVRIALVAAALALWPVAAAVGAHREDQSRTARLAESLVPPLGPDLAAYRAGSPWIRTDAPVLSYTLTPKGTAAPDREVRVVVSALRADFAPPQCRASSATGKDLDLVCTPLTASSWRAVMYSDTVVYFVRHGEAVVTLTADGVHVTDDTLSAMAASLAVRSADYFG